TRQNTGRSRLVTYRRRTSASAGVNSSAAYMYMRRLTLRPPRAATMDGRRTSDDHTKGVGLYPNGQIAAPPHHLAVEGNREQSGQGDLHGGRPSLFDGG